MKTALAPLAAFVLIHPGVKKKEKKIQNVKYLSTKFMVFMSTLRKRTF